MSQYDCPILIEGSSGKIEVVVDPCQHASTRHLAIICHPHSLQGGSMNNKVVTTLSRAFKALNITAIRFNFRGVGRSEGEFDHGVGEVDDCLTVIKWAQQHFPYQQLLLAGFSFGSYVAARAALVAQPRLLITVAPPVTRFDFASLPTRHEPWILVQADDDEVVESQAVYDWYESLEIKPALIHFPQAGHFFHGKLIELRDKLIYTMKQFPELTLNHEHTD